MFIVPPKYVARAKDEFKKRGPTELDRGMWQTCRVINLIDDVAALSSSSGHPEVGDSQFNVTLIAASALGERNIEQLFKIWCSYLGTHLPEAGGSAPIHHHTSMIITRLADPYVADDTIWTHQLTTLVDGEFNTPLKVTQYLQLAANRLVI